MSKSGWYKVGLRHDDGRTGTITSEFNGFMHVGLTITVDGAPDQEHIRLNNSSKDSGALGWRWRYSRDGEPEAWAYLGDHNPSHVANVPVEATAAAS